MDDVSMSTIDQSFISGATPHISSFNITGLPNTPITKERVLPKLQLKK
jgi:hypothetical protein